MTFRVHTPATRCLVRRTAKARGQVSTLEYRVVRLQRICVVLIALCCVVGCGSNAPAPIEDRTGSPERKRVQSYTVLSGDTLYSLAFRFGLDYRRLAAANNIREPFTIYPGQQLRLVESALRADRNSYARAPTATDSTATSAGPASSGSAASSRSSSSSRPSAPSSPVTSNQGQAAKGAGSTATGRSRIKADSSSDIAGHSSSQGSSSTAPPVPAATAARSRSVESSTAGWLWPATGPVIRRFDAELNKGIDLGGSRGDQVRASATGEVVYAGSGIAGYGLMLIVRHSNGYLSAYGHNQRLLVAEGVRVSAGQTIAERGSSGTDSVKLHFEIRKNGRPIDPLTVLPPRKA